MYHIWVWGGDNLAVRLPPHLLESFGKSVLLDTIRQIIIDYSEYLAYTDFRTLVRLSERRNGMSTQEIELFKIINENDNPEKAVLTAIEVFTAILEQPSAVPALQPVCLQESF